MTTALNLNVEQLHFLKEVLLQRLYVEEDNAVWDEDGETSSTDRAKDMISDILTIMADSFPAGYCWTSLPELEGVSQ